MANILNWRNQVELTSGDTIRVHQEVQEGDRTRTQIFEGIVIRIKGHIGLKSFTVRKIGANSIGVEKIFPEDTPTVTNVEIVKKGKVRRANLGYLRDRVGKKATKIKAVFVKGVKQNVEAEVLDKGGTTEDEESRIAKRVAKMEKAEKLAKKAEKGEKAVKKSKKKKKIVTKERRVNK